MKKVYRNKVVFVVYILLEAPTGMEISTIAVGAIVLLCEFRLLHGVHIFSPGQIFNQNYIYL